MKTIAIPALLNGKKVFFASDIHLPIWQSNRQQDPKQENKIIAWLDYIESQSAALFLLGDLFNFWFEYKYLIPKGAIRLQAKLLSFHAANIPVYFFLGNHDRWVLDYFTQACGVQIFKEPASMMIGNSSFHIGHGDTLNPSPCYSMASALYNHRFVQWVARHLPADWLYAFTNYYLQRKSRKYKSYAFSDEKDRIFQYCKTRIEPTRHHDFYIFGHVHVPCIHTIDASSIYCNLGDWVKHDTYGCFDGHTFSLHAFDAVRV